MSTLAFDSDLKLRNLVPEDSQIIQACNRGDTGAVWDLFQSGKATVNDVTPSYRSPLFVSQVFDASFVRCFLKLILHIACI